MRSNLTDSCISVIKKLNLPKIKFISLFDSKIASPEIFSSIQNFHSLQKFFIGDNPIDIKKLPDKNIIYNFPPNLIELGISNIFTKETNKFIVDNLNLENLKALYVNGDEITSLKMFQNVKFKQLEEFWTRRGKNKDCLHSIEEIKYLQGKKSIKKIILEQNKINDIKEFVKIENSFPNLELLNIEDNEISQESITLFHLLE